MRKPKNPDRPTATIIPFPKRDDSNMDVAKVLRYILREIETGKIAPSAAICFMISFTEDGGCAAVPYVIGVNELEAAGFLLRAATDIVS